MVAKYLESKFKLRIRYVGQYSHVLRLDAFVWVEFERQLSLQNLSQTCPELCRKLCVFIHFLVQVMDLVDIIECQIMLRGETS